MAESARISLTGKSPFRAMMAYCMPYWPAFLTGSALASAFLVVELCMPLLIRRIIEQFMSALMTKPMLVIYFVLLILIAVAAGIGRYFQRAIMIRASRKVEYDLRNDYFDQVQRLSPAFFHEHMTGDIMARATNDLNYVRSVIGPGIMNTVNMLRLPFTLAVMIYLSPQLTLIALIPLPFVSLLVYMFVRYMHKQSEIVQDQFGVVTARAQENLAGARVVKAYGIEERELREFTAESTHYMRENLKLSIVMAMSWPMIGLSIECAVLAVVWRGGIMTIDNNLTVGDLTAFYVCLAMLAWPLAEFGWVLTLYQRGIVSMKRILDVLAVQPDIRDNDSTNHSLTVASGGIQFEEVSFAYDGEPVLKDVSFTINPGQTVAVVGPTGAGKSTLVSLLLRDYDPQSGRILVDNHDVRHYSLHALRSAIGCVPQDAFLFSDTIRANVTFGRPEATEDEIDRACVLAQFEETVAQLPAGYETLLGERGVNLSGGQKQRLTIARAVVRDPMILILDDALSSVDTHTEEEILTRLRKVMNQRTSIIISHRISTVRDADLILVMDEGRIVESGAHAALVERSGLYAAMYERQMIEAELEEQA